MSNQKYSERDYGVRLTQNTEEWLRFRAGKLGASAVKDILRGKRGDYLAAREKRKAIIACERLSGEPYEGFKSPAMEMGHEREDEARAAYFLFTGDMPESTGCWLHPGIAYFEASPDGLVGDDGLVEIKCPEPHTHYGYIEHPAYLIDQYETQCLAQFAVTRRVWIDLMSYHPAFPPRHRLLVTRLERVEYQEEIDKVEDEVQKFLTEVGRAVERLSA